MIQIGTGHACRLKDAAIIVGGLAKKILNKDVAPRFDLTKPEVAPNPNPDPTPLLTLPLTLTLTLIRALPSPIPKGP